MSSKLKLMSPPREKLVKLANVAISQGLRARCDVYARKRFMRTRLLRETSYLQIHLYSVIFEELSPFSLNGHLDKIQLHHMQQRETPDIASISPRR